MRGVTESDGATIYRMRSMARISEFIARQPMRDETEGFELAKKTREAFENRTGIGWTGILRGKGESIGTCGFNAIDIPNLHGEIGGEMSTRYWGKGIAQEAFQAIVRFGLYTMNLQTIEAKVAPGNRSAIHLLLESGFVKEAHFKRRIYFNEQFLDLAVYTLHKGSERI